MGDTDTIRAGMLRFGPVSWKLWALNSRWWKKRVMCFLIYLNIYIYIHVFVYIQLCNMFCKRVKDFWGIHFDDLIRSFHQGCHVVALCLAGFFLYGTSAKISHAGVGWRFVLGDGRFHPIWLVSAWDGWPSYPPYSRQKKTDVHFCVQLTDLMVTDLAPSSWRMAPASFSTF